MRIPIDVERSPGDHEEVEAWRLRVLLDAGYDLRHAEKLARRRHVDLHQAVELARKPECGPELAARILA